MAHTDYQYQSGVLQLHDGSCPAAGMVNSDFPGRQGEKKISIAKKSTVGGTLSRFASRIEIPIVDFRMEVHFGVEYLRGSKWHLWASVHFLPSLTPYSCRRLGFFCDVCE